MRAAEKALKKPLLLEEFGKKVRRIVLWFFPGFLSFLK